VHRHGADPGLTTPLRLGFSQGGARGAARMIAGAAPRSTGLEAGDAGED